MNAVRRYFPLVSFVLPTVVIGYGFVIPRSPIAGVNELTIGFATTILGAVMTYIAGQRAVMPRDSTKPSLFARVSHAINRQAASPSGPFGRLLGFIWRRDHARLNGEVLDCLDVRPGDSVLEIGSGPGYALAEAARRTAGARVVGIDISELMAKLARDRNRDAGTQGRVEIRVGDVASLDVEPAAFDRIFSVHCVYFWRDLDAVLGKLTAGLRPAGKLVLAFRPESDDIPARFRDGTYRFPRSEEVERALEKHGLDRVSTSDSSIDPHCVLVRASKRA